MKRTIAMLGAALVLLLLASGFMAADNIRLSGEKAALTDKFNDQSYEYSLLYHQLQSAKQQIGELTRERDELQLELQDYQPGKAMGEDASAEEIAAGEESTGEESAEPPAETAADKGSEDLALFEKGMAQEAEESPSDEAANTENIFASDADTAQKSEQARKTEEAANLALPLVPAVESAMADTAPAAPEDTDTLLQLEQLRQEVQALSRQVDMLRAQLFASRMNETGMGAVLSAPSGEVTPAPSSEPPTQTENMFLTFPDIPDIRQWADALQEE